MIYWNVKEVIPLKFKDKDKQRNKSKEERRGGGGELIDREMKKQVCFRPVSIVVML